MITHETRRGSYEDIKSKRKRRYDDILYILSFGEKTAKEIAVAMYNLEMIPGAERNYTAPRLTELEKMGYVMVVGKKQCQWTCKKVAMYSATGKRT